MDNAVDNCPKSQKNPLKNTKIDKIMQIVYFVNKYFILGLFPCKKLSKYGSIWAVRLFIFFLIYYDKLLGEKYG